MVSVHEHNFGRADYAYDTQMQRTHAWYGGEEENLNSRTYQKHYSSLFPAEITVKKAGTSTGSAPSGDTERAEVKTTIVFYVGGDGYTAPAAKINDEIHYLHRDYLGSILAISDSSGGVLEERQFGAWGEVDFFKTSTGSVFTNEEANKAFSESILPRGFTGHEHFSEIALIHMNGRMYDPQLRRFLSPDNFIQDPYDTRSYDRFGYVWHNPLMLNDPSGEIIPFLIAAAIGGVVNLAVNAIQGNINSWGDGFAAFGAGAAAGGLALLGPAGWAAGGAIVGGANAYLGGATSFQDIAQGAFIGAASGLVGGAVGQYAAKSLGNVLINGFNVTSPVIKGAIGGAVGGAAGGYAGGFTGGLLSTGNFEAAHKAGVGGLASGAAIGGVAGGVGAYASAKRQGINPWTGKYSNAIAIGRGQEARIDPAARDLNAETISNDWNKNFGRNRLSNKQSLDFNYDWFEGKLDLDYKVFDLGSGNFNNYSPNYTLELNSLQYRNYQSINVYNRTYLNGNFRFNYFKN